MNIQEFEQFLNEIVVISDKLKSFIYNCAVKSSEINFKGEEEEREFNQTYLNKISDEMKKLSIFTKDFINSVHFKAYEISDNAWNKK